MKKFESWMREMFANRQMPEVCYHNLDHTLLIVEKVNEIGKYYQLSDQDLEDLFYAGWLHDVGYWDGVAEGHEQQGADLAQNCLTELGLPDERVQRIKSAILATKVPQKPKDLFESIICDSDLYHLSSDLFYEQTLLLRKEKESALGKKIPLEEWLKGTRDFMESHHYHSEYAINHFQPGKEKNKLILEEKIEDAELLAKKKGKKKGKNKKSDRGVETMFRVTSKNHMELSSIADNKANIMISVNSIIISIVVTVLIRKLEEFPNYTIPAILLISTCLGAMVFAILATRPKVTHGSVSEESIGKKESNLLYFGNFYEMSLQEYTSGMHAMIEDGSFLYDSMIRDIYFLGKVLAVKYKLLRKSYNIFMFGFIISILSFLIASIFFEPLQY
ncbi:Pycsar system effector family protein [Algoriphagus halophilus]|uniref:Pycsar system effector family protein n=1 Tax=Algoriphagus halophilus TaxID=226505 RepID=UPI001F32CDF3|nr:Pycsar system effector family protein [Algoriphagus halophilus]